MAVPPMCLTVVAWCSLGVAFACACWIVVDVHVRSAGGPCGPCRVTGVHRHLLGGRGGGSHPVSRPLAYR
jgi:hypothetical protein